MRKILIMVCCAMMLLSGCGISKQSDVKDEKTDSKAESYKGRYACADSFCAYITEEGKVHILDDNGAEREIKQIEDAIQISPGMDELIVLNEEGKIIIYSVIEDKIITDFSSSSEATMEFGETMGAGVGAYIDWRKSLSECNDVEKLLGSYDGPMYYIAFKKDKSVVGSSMTDANFQDKVDECALWDNITKYICNGTDIMGLKEDGTVICTNEEISSELAEEWTDIIDIKASGSFLGLKADGTVLSLVGELEYTTLGWSDVKQISASLFCATGLREDGTVDIAGRD